MARAESTLPQRPLRSEGTPRSKRRRDTLLAVSIMAVLLAIILAVIFTSPLLMPSSEAKQIEIGFTDLEGNHRTIGEAPFTGNVVLVDLMAANCPPCNAEMPALLSFREAVRDRDLEMVSLSIWVNQPGFGESLHDLRDFREGWGADWTFGVPDDTLALVVEYEVHFPPFKILVDRDGRVIWTRAGETTAEDLLQAVSEVL